jgi:hypothetical protein
VATALATHLAAGASGLLRIDVQPDERALLAWGQAAGLVPVGRTPFMSFQGAPRLGRREFTRALAGRAFG